ncbi:MAG: hypothetical protein ACTTH0_06115 [Eubacteriales bacterium]
MTMSGFLDKISGIAFSESVFEPMTSPRFLVLPWKLPYTDIVYPWFKKQAAQEKIFNNRTSYGFSYESL